MRRFTKKTTALLVGLVMVIVGAGVAYAYWTSGGGGTGGGTTGTAEDLVVNQTSVVTDMGPGVAPQVLSGDFDNPSAGPVYVGVVTAAITSITGAGAGGCAVDDYFIDNPTSTVDAEVPIGPGVGAWGQDTPQMTIEFANSATDNQDGCQGAAVVITYSIGPLVP